MLINKLEKGIETISEIVSITQQEINQIEAADNKILFNNISTKNQLITLFYKQKQNIDNHINEIAKDNPELNIKECLNEEEVILLTKLQDRLIQLQSINTIYKKIVVALGDFYLSMLDKLLPNRVNGYNNQSNKQNFINIDI